MKKKTVANMVMAAIILVIVAAGVLGVGCIQGWFDADDGTRAVLCDIVGVVNLERDGVSYPVTADTVLRGGDRITCKNGSAAGIRVGEDSLVIGENAALSITDASAGSFAADVSSGELFASCAGSAVFTFEGHTTAIRNAVVLLSVRSGAQTVTVLSGTVDGVSAGHSVEYIGEEITASLLRIGSLNDFAVKQIRNANKTASLCVTDAELDQMEADRKAALQEAINNAGSIQTTDPDENGHVHSYMDNVVTPTCTEGGYTVYTCACGDSYRDSETAPAGHTWGDWVTTVQPTARQEGAKQRQCLYCDAEETQTLAKLSADHVHSYTVKTVAATCTTEGYTLYTCGCGSSYRDNIVAASGHRFTDTVVAPTCTVGGYTAHTCACGYSYKDAQTAAGHSWSDWVVTKEATKDAEGMKERACKRCGQTQQATIDKLAAPIAGYVYITIRCDTILDNMDNLNPGKAEFVPADGEILPMVSVYFYEGETVFEVLKRVCAIAGIQLEYSWTPLYGSYYIEGIHNLYEFDCGNESGWMYKVNEWFPNYGCSGYYPEDGDVIVWCYSCNGLGADVGDVWMDES